MMTRKWRKLNMTDQIYERQTMYDKVIGMN